jgi:hypothetical protein
VVPHIIAAICVLVASCTVASAQSDVDAFNPGTNGSVNAIVMQPDGRSSLAAIRDLIGAGETRNVAQ